jgi:hypothetical protein
MTIFNRTVICYDSDPHRTDPKQRYAEVCILCLENILKRLEALERLSHARLSHAPLDPSWTSRDLRRLQEDKHAD